jgi:cytochrome d ubiquinol oxidase subunit II
VPAGGKAGDPVDSWVNLTSVMTGFLGVATVAYLSAVYLVWAARRMCEPEMADYFRRRAVGSGVVVAVLGAVTAIVMKSDAPHVFDGLTSRASPIAVLSMLCGGAALILLVGGAVRGARLLAVLAVAALTVAWGVAQWPYILPESLTFSSAAAPTSTLVTVTVAAGLAAALVVPGFVLLYTLDQRDLLTEEDEPSSGQRSPTA